MGDFGHGVQYGSDAYFCPFDAGVRDVQDADGKIVRDSSDTVMLAPDPDTLVSMRSMLETLTRSGASNKILLADCCRDWYESDYYALSPSRDPTGPFKGSGRVDRGGSWRSSVLECRSAHRGWRTPDAGAPDLGFRVSLQSVQ